MSGFVISQSFAKHLEDAGLLPAECVNVELLMPADGLIQLRYTINLAPSDIESLGEAFTEFAKELVKNGP